MTPTVLVYTPKEAAKALGIGATKVYELIGSGQLRAVRIGTAVRVPIVECQAYLDRLLAEQHPAA
jgi:excisionase family DNA binding protein